MAGTACGSCGAILDEVGDLPPHERNPCPHCGSLVRQYSVEAKVEGGAAVTVSADVLTATGEVRAVANVASLLMQGLITPGSKTGEGKLIEAVALPWFDIIDLLKRDSKIAFQISPEKWEEIVLHLPAG